MAGCCAWRRRRRRAGHAIGGESSSDEREEFDKTPRAQSPTPSAYQYVASLLKQKRPLVDEDSYHMLRSAEVDDDEYSNWTAETLDLLRDGGGSENLSDLLRTPIRRGVPDEYKRYVILRASEPTGMIHKHTQEFVRLLEKRVFGDSVPDYFDGELPTFTFGFLGPEIELHQKAQQIDIQVDLGRYTNPRGSVATINSVMRGAAGGSMEGKPAALGSVARLGSFNLHRIHPEGSFNNLASDLGAGNNSYDRNTSIVPPLPADFPNGHAKNGAAGPPVPRSASFTDLHQHIHQRITRTDSDTQLLDQVKHLGPNVAGGRSLRSLMSLAGMPQYSSQPRLMAAGSILRTMNSAQKLSDGTLPCEPATNVLDSHTPFAQNTNLAGSGPGASTHSLSDIGRTGSDAPLGSTVMGLVASMKTMTGSTTKQSSHAPIAQGHSLEESTVYAAMLTREGQYVASKIMWMVNGYYSQVEFAPILAPLICILLYYVDEREALATVMYVLERSVELLKNKSPRAFMTLRRSEFVRLVKQAVAISEKHLSGLYTHLEELGVDLPGWLARGLQDGFSRIVPFDLLVRMYISFLYDGVKAFLRYGIAMLLMAEERLLECVSADEANHVLLFRELRSCGPQHLNELTKLAYKTRVKHTKKPITAYAETEMPPTPYLQRTQEVPKYYRPRIYDKSEVLTDAAWIKIWRCLPNHCRILDPYLKFTTSKDGCGINAMIRALWNYSDLAMISAILTRTGDIIILFSPITFRPDYRSVMDSVDVSGTFIGAMRQDTRNFDVYYHQGLGKRIMIVNNDHIYFGDPQVLSIDSNLDRGQSVACDNSPILVADKFGDFSITLMEVWILE